MRSNQPFNRLIGGISSRYKDAVTNTAQYASLQAGKYAKNPDRAHQSITTAQRALTGDTRRLKESIDRGYNNMVDVGAQQVSTLGQRFSSNPNAFHDRVTQAHRTMKGTEFKQNAGVGVAATGVAGAGLLGAMSASE